MQSTPHHLLNTSWTLHRLSPLHHGKEFQSVVDNPTALNTYATRLRDQLTGDVLAGLQQPAPVAGEDDDGLSKTGALKTCTWESIGMSLIEDEDEGEEEGEGEGRNVGILIVLEYENATYKAVMLPGLKPAAPGNTTSTTPIPTTITTREGSTHLPLLMTRLPTGLRQTVISFLSSNFDTYCTALRLPMSFMCTGLETYADAFLSNDDNDNDSSIGGIDTLQSAVKDMHLTLSFSKSIAPALKALNITVPRASFDEFLRSSPGTGGTASSKAFLSNISRYIEKHLSLKLDLNAAASPTAQTPAKQHVRLSKIACGGFVLGSEGRIKLVATGPEDTSRSRDDEDSQTRTERERLELRGSEALLRAVMRRVGSSTVSVNGSGAGAGAGGQLR